MGYERRNAKMYFYLHHRQSDGRKWKQYYGHGFDATMAAHFLMLRQVARTFAAKILSQLKAVTQEADELLTSYCKGVSELLATEMLVAGFHNSRSRGWRKLMTTDLNAAKETRGSPLRGTDAKPRRPQGTNSTGAGTSSKPAASEAKQKKRDSQSPSNAFSAALMDAAIKSNRVAYEKFRKESDARTANQAANGKPPDASATEHQSPPPKPVEDMSQDELFAAAMLGDAAAMKRLRPMMQRDSASFKKIGDLGAMAVEKWFDVHCRQDLCRREGLKAFYGELRAEHLKEGDSPIEKLLIEEVLLCWLRQKYWISFEANSYQSAPDTKSLKFSMDQTRAAQRMYLKALAELRDYRSVKTRLP